MDEKWKAGYAKAVADYEDTAAIGVSGAMRLYPDACDGWLSGYIDGSSDVAAEMRRLQYAKVNPYGMSAARHMTQWARDMGINRPIRPYTDFTGESDTL